MSIETLLQPRPTKVTPPRSGRSDTQIMRNAVEAVLQHLQAALASSTISRTSLLLCPALLLAACQQGDRTTMDLLRAGDAGVCIARDVEATLRQLVLPPGKEAANYTVGLSDTTLEAFDKAVARATCNTALTVQDSKGTTIIERVMIDYVVAPSAQNPDTFLVSGEIAPLRARVTQAMITAEEDRVENEAFRQKTEALNALVKPGWLIGRWVPDPASSEACSDGPYDQFNKGGSYDGYETVGRWALKGIELAIAAEGDRTTRYIEAATMDTMSIATGHGGTAEYRRCSKAEMQPTIVDDVNVTEGIDSPDPGLIDD